MLSKNENERENGKKKASANARKCAIAKKMKPAHKSKTH